MKAGPADPRAMDPWHCSLHDFESADAAMRRCLDLARVAARTDLPILVLGESGTGKTLLATAIHNSSKRAKGPFVPFNAAALSDTLVDSQLFGHERGAFTGAHKSVKGKFELADGGTLFIDEIADMSPAFQAKILRAIEFGEFERLGSEALRRADVRLISATHWPAQRLIEAEWFRKDLFYRISGLTIVVPPLRERPNDLRSLIAREVALAGQQQRKPIAGLDKMALELLLSCPWPGNLRELKTVIQAAVALAPGDIITSETILLTTPARPSTSPVEGIPPREGRDAWEKERAPNGSPKALDPHPDPMTELSLAAAEHQHIRTVLGLVGGNKRRAARALGISRATLDRKLGQMVPPRNSQ